MFDKKVKKAKKGGSIDFDNLLTNSILAKFDIRSGDTVPNVERKDTLCGKSFYEKTGCYVDVLNFGAEKECGRISYKTYNLGGATARYEYIFFKDCIDEYSEEALALILPKLLVESGRVIVLDKSDAVTGAEIKLKNILTIDLKYEGDFCLLSGKK